MRPPIDHYLPRILLCLWCAICAGQEATAEEFVQDFRGRPYDVRYFRSFGSNTHRAMRTDFRGLRISPVDPESRIPVGLVARVGVRGDFEITMTFEVLRLYKPAGGNDAGLSIYVSSASLTKEAATLGRFVRTDGEQIILCHHASTPQGEERRHQGKRVPKTALTGQLRLVRRGTLLSYQFAEGTASAFQELYQTEWVGEDLDTVRFAMENGNPPTVVDVLIRAVSIRADDFGPARPVPQPFRWTMRMTMGLLAILLATFSLWFWLRWRRGS
jgi:hypothetical protein